MPERKAELTPGEWRTGRRDMQSYRGSDGQPVVYVYRGDDGAERVQVSGPNCWPDALAMAAAKDLLAALRPFAEEGVDLTDATCHLGIVSVKECARCREVLAARDAIAKAEGR